MYNLIFGVLFIIGGITGTAVLRGTNSTTGLIGVGAIFAVIGLIQMSNAKSKAGTRRGAARPRRGRSPGGRSGTGRMQPTGRAGINSQIRRRA